LRAGTSEGERRVSECTGERETWDEREESERRAGRGGRGKGGKRTVNDSDHHHDSSNDVEDEEELVEAHTNGAPGEETEEEETDDHLGEGKKSQHRRKWCKERERRTAIPV
jgi:hypothetical protein